MKYNFFTKEISNSKYYCIESDNVNYKILARFTDDNWTSFKAMEIIDSVESSKASPKGEEYIWGNEDVTLYSNINGVLLEDMISQRFGEDKIEELTLLLDHDTFIGFLQDFKKFIEENS